VTHQAQPLAIRDQPRPIKRETYENVSDEVPCPFARENGTHPLVEKFGAVYQCRHCGKQVAITPSKTLLGLGGTQ
jgi:hypothetical protein